MDEQQEDILSPPYPDPWVSSHRMYDHLTKLKEWAEEYGPRLNERIGRDVIPAVRKFAPKSAYAMQPVMTLFGHILFMRRLREQWDHLYRQNENSWDNEKCVGRRVLIVQAAILMLNAAFVPQEHREARGHEGMNDLQRIFENIQRVLDSQMEAGNHDPDPEA